MSGREEYAVRLAHAAARIVAAVHDDGPDDIRTALAEALEIPPPIGTDPSTALVAILAAMVDPTRTTAHPIEWIGPNRAAGHLRPARDIDGSCSAIADRIVAAVRGRGTVDVPGLVAEALRIPAPAGTDPHTALVVTVAGMVDPTRSVADLLAWTKLRVDATSPVDRDCREWARRIVEEHLARNGGLVAVQRVVRGTS